MCKKKLITIWLLMFAYLQTQNCMAASFPVFSIVLNSDSDTPKGDVSTNLQTVCVYVNGNPVGIFPGHNSIAISINHFVKSGTNEIRLVDSAARLWNAVIVQADQTDAGKTIVETNFKASSSGSIVVINLTNVNWSLPLFNSVISDTDASKSSVLEFVKTVFNALADENKSAAVNLLQKDGIAIWQPKAYGVEADVVINAIAETEKEMQSIQSVVESPNENAIKIVRGQNAMLIYTGFLSKESQARAFLGRLKLKNGSEDIMSPLIIYRQSGRWAIWQ